MSAGPSKLRRYIPTTTVKGSEKVEPPSWLPLQVPGKGARGEHVPEIPSNETITPADVYRAKQPSTPPNQKSFDSRHMPSTASPSLNSTNSARTSPYESSNPSSSAESACVLTQSNISSHDEDYYASFESQQMNICPLLAPQQNEAPFADEGPAPSGGASTSCRRPGPVLSTSSTESFSGNSEDNLPQDQRSSEARFSEQPSEAVHVNLNATNRKRQRRKRASVSSSSQHSKKKKPVVTRNAKKQAEWSRRRLTRTSTRFCQFQTCEHPAVYDEVFCHVHRFGECNKLEPFCSRAATDTYGRCPAHAFCATKGCNLEVALDAKGFLTNACKIHGHHAKQKRVHTKSKDESISAIAETAVDIAVPQESARVAIENTCTERATSQSVKLESVGAAVARSQQVVKAFNDRATERLKQAPNILPANALSEAFEKSNDDGGGAAAAAGALSSADLRADTLKLATSLKFATEIYDQHIKYAISAHTNLLAKLNGDKSASNAALKLNMPDNFALNLRDDFDDMFRDGEAINGNTRQIVVPDPDAKRHSDQRISYAHFESLNEPFRSKVDNLLKDNVEQLRGIAACETGSHSSKMVISMAAILLSDGTDGQGPHVDQYKSTKAVQLIVYLSDGPGTRIFNAPDDDKIKQASKSLQIDLVHCRTAARCGALLLDRKVLDAYQIPAMDVSPGDVWVIPGDRVHSAPPSKGKRAVLFLMFDHKDEFAHYSHDVQLNRLGCLTECWLEMSPGIRQEKRMDACKQISESLCTIANEEQHEVPWSILANSDYDEIRTIATELEMFAKSNGKGKWAKARVVGRIQDELCDLTINEVPPNLITKRSNTKLPKRARTKEQPSSSHAAKGSGRAGGGARARGDGCSGGGGSRRKSTSGNGERKSDEIVAKANFSKGGSTGRNGKKGSRRSKARPAAGSGGVRIRNLCSTFGCTFKRSHKKGQSKNDFCTKHSTVCSSNGCRKPVHDKGVCMMHLKDPTSWQMKSLLALITLETWSDQKTGHSWRSVQNAKSTSEKDSIYWYNTFTKEVQWNHPGMEFSQVASSVGRDDEEISSESSGYVVHDEYTCEHCGEFTRMDYDANALQKVHEHEMACKKTKGHAPGRRRRSLHSQKKCRTEKCQTIITNGSHCQPHFADGICSLKGCRRDVLTGRIMCHAHCRGLCAVEDCKEAYSVGILCGKHGALGLCFTEGCAENATASGYCKAHSSSLVCTVAECREQAVKKGRCKPHRKTATAARPEARPKARTTAARPSFPACKPTERKAERQAGEGPLKRKCNVSTCNNRSCSRGLCGKHGRGGSSKIIPLKRCTYKGCSKTVFARGRCKQHKNRT